MEDRWVGNDYYYIVFKNGTHHLYCSWLCKHEPETVFTGSYEKCRQRLDEIEVDYLESQF